MQKLALKAMVSIKDYLNCVVDQIENVGKITYQHMFGEYGVGADGKLFALVGDNKLFLKPTEGSRAIIGVKSSF